MSKIARTPALPATVSPDDPKVVVPPVDWKRAFQALAFVTCRGFVSSEEVEEWVEFVRKVAGPVPAATLVRTFNRTREKWVHDLMG
jgi:hypothetical protein